MAGATRCGALQREYSAVRRPTSLKGIITLSVCGAVALSALEHRALWGYFLTPAVAIAGGECKSAWQGVSLPRGDAGLNVGRLPSEFDQLLARTRPQGLTTLGDGSSASAFLVQRLAGGQAQAQCLVLECQTPPIFGGACLLPVPSDDDRHRYEEALFVKDSGTAIAGPVVWFTEVSGMEILTLPVLLAANLFLALIFALVFAARRAGRLPWNPGRA